MYSNICAYIIKIQKTLHCIYFCLVGERTNIWQMLIILKVVRCYSEECYIEAYIEQNKTIWIFCFKFEFLSVHMCVSNTFSEILQRYVHIICTAHPFNCLMVLWYHKYGFCIFKFVQLQLTVTALCITYYITTYYWSVSDVLIRPDSSYIYNK